MKRIGILLSVLVMVFGLAVSAQAALVDMNDGTIYDTDTQLSWLKDADYVSTSGYDADGRLTWDQAVAWAASLNAGGGFAGLTGWRLPTTAQLDTSCDSNFNPGGGFPIQYHNLNCTNSEMGHLYYTEGVTSSSPDPFTDVQAFGYWSVTEYVPNPSGAWVFIFDVGRQDAYEKEVFFYAWAVRPGARSQAAPTAVPAIGTMGLIIFGLAGLIFSMRRLKSLKT